MSISTNGILYSTEKVQKYIKKNAGKVSIGITIDGTKEKMIYKEFILMVVVHMRIS